MLAWLAAWGDLDPGSRPALLTIDIAIGLIAYALVGLRRRWPLPIAILITVMSAVSSVAAGPAVLASVSLATRRVVWQVVLVGVLGFCAGMVFEEGMTVPDNPLWLIALWNAGLTAAMMGWGMYIGSRRELLYTLNERALRAEAERDLRVESARSHERALIAREMHDVLAHRISQVSMFAGALAYREDLSAAEMRESAGLIQTQANEALSDLRAVLGVLRDADGQPQNRPQPTFKDIAALIAETKASGMRIAFTDEVEDPEGMSPQAGRTLYRIVQEGLTNARKHAPGALVRVELSGDAKRGVDAFIRNPTGFVSTPAVPGAGLGLVGMAERAQLSGGRLEHRREGAQFVLHAWIPWSP